MRRGTRRIGRVSSTAIDGLRKLSPSYGPCLSIRRNTRSTAIEPLALPPLILERRLIAHRHLWFAVFVAAAVFIVVGILVIQRLRVQAFFPVLFFQFVIQRLLHILR